MAQQQIQRLREAHAAIEQAFNEAGDNQLLASWPFGAQPAALLEGAMVKFDDGIVGVVVTAQQPEV